MPVSKGRVICREPLRYVMTGIIAYHIWHLIRASGCHRRGDMLYATTQSRQRQLWYSTFNAMMSARAKAKPAGDCRRTGDSVKYLIFISRQILGSSRQNKNLSRHHFCGKFNQIGKKKERERKKEEATSATRSKHKQAGGARCAGLIRSTSPIQ